MSESEAMEIGIEKLDFGFVSKPLLIGGKAMEEGGPWVSS
jgi:hypothetical protein